MYQGSLPRSLVRPTLHTKVVKCVDFVLNLIFQKNLYGIEYQLKQKIIEIYGVFFSFKFRFFALISLIVV